MQNRKAKDRKQMRKEKHKEIKAYKRELKKKKKLLKQQAANNDE